MVSCQGVRAGLSIWSNLGPTMRRTGRTTLTDVTSALWSGLFPHIFRACVLCGLPQNLDLKVTTTCAGHPEAYSR